MSTTAGPDEDRTRMPDAAAGAAPAPGTLSSPITSPIAPTVSSTGTPRTFASDGEAEVLPVGTRLQEFEITGLVGIGGFGIVYTAHDHSLGRTVALKEYLPTSLAARGPGRTITIRSSRHRESFDAGLRSFVNEARLLARFDHPSLVKVFRFWEENGTAYMVMPYYAGDTLKARLRSLDAPPSEAWLRKLATALCAALDVLHKQSIFHRDIAPDNVILVEDDRPVLLDFGAARHVIGDLTQNLTVILKPGYAPIEQYGTSIDMRQGAWTDLYALAGVLRYAILGSPPVPAVNRILTDDMRPLAEEARGRCSASFLAAIDAALAVRPEGRPRDVAAFIALFDKPVEAPAAQPLEAPRIPSPEPARTSSAASKPAPAMPHAPAPAPAAKRAAAPATKPAPTANDAPPAKSRALPIAVLVGLVVAAGVAAWLIADNLGGSKAPPVVAKPTPAEPREASTPDPSRSPSPSSTQQASTPSNDAPSPPREQTTSSTTTAPSAPTTPSVSSTLAPAPASPPPVVATPAPPPATKPPPRTLPPREREVASVPHTPPPSPAPQSVPTAPQPVTTAPATPPSTPAAPPSPPPDPKIAEAADLVARARDSLARREYARAAEYADRALALRPGDAQAQELRRQARAGEKAAFESIKIE